MANHQFKSAISMSIFNSSGYIYIYWLVVWNMNFMTFHNIWDVILPID